MGQKSGKIFSSRSSESGNGLDTFLNPLIANASSCCADSYPHLTTNARDHYLTASSHCSRGVSLSRELKLEGWVCWVAVCCCGDTGDFCSDASGRVVPANSEAAAGSSLPNPCLIATVSGRDHLTMLSVDGAVCLRSYCSAVDWSEGVTGLHCDDQRQQVFVAQSAKVTVADLSGRPIRRILPASAGFVSFWGVSGNATTMFASGGCNRIAAFSKTSGQLARIITLRKLPQAELGCLAVHQEDYILAVDRRLKKVHEVCLDKHRVQVVASHPTQCAGLKRFNKPLGVAVDSRGCVFVSEWLGHSVRAVAPVDEDGGKATTKLLWTLGVPGERGAGGIERLSCPCSLAVVAAARGSSSYSGEQLIVADRWNRRLLVLELH